MPRTEDEEIEGRKSKTDAQGMGAGVEWHKGWGCSSLGEGKSSRRPRKEIFLCFFSPVSFLNSQTLDVMWQEGAGWGQGESTEIRSVKNFPSPVYFFLIFSLLFSLVHSIPSFFPLPKYPT